MSCSCRLVALVKQAVSAMSLAMTFTSNFRLLAVIKQAVSAMSLALSFAVTLSVILCLT